MKEQKMPKKRRSRAGIYTMLSLVIFILLGLVAFVAFANKQTLDQINVLEEKLLQGNEAVEDINMKLGQIQKDMDVADELETPLKEDSSEDIGRKDDLSELDTAVFKSSDFPFTFEYDPDWLLSEPGDEQEIAGEPVISLQSNELSLLSPEDASYIEDALQLEGADYVDSTVLITFLENEDIESATEAFYDEIARFERVEVLTIGAYQVEVYQNENSFSLMDDYFVEYGSDVLVFTVSSGKYAGELIQTLK